jgi:hypothetical protein
MMTQYNKKVSRGVFFNYIYTNFKKIHIKNSVYLAAFNCTKTSQSRFLYQLFTLLLLLVILLRGYPSIPRCFAETLKELLYTQ